MKPISFFGALIALTLLLTSCADMYVDGGIGGVDPRQEIAGAEATIDTGQLQLTRTARAIEQQQASATLQAARTQGAAQIEIDRLQAQMQAEQQQFDLAVAAARYTEDAARAQETRQAAETAQAEQHARQTQVAGPTATAEQLILDHERKLLEQTQYRDYFWLWFWPVAAVIILIVLVAAGIVSIRMGWILVQDHRKNRAVQNSVRAERGRVMPLVDGALPAGYLDTASPIMMRGAPDPVHKIGHTGMVLASPMPPRNGNGNGANLQGKVIAFLERVIEVQGSDSTTIPRWDKLGVTSDTWKEMIRPLVEKRVVDVQARVITRVSDEIGTVADLLDMIELGRLQLTTSWPPAPFNVSVGEG